MPEETPWVVRASDVKPKNREWLWDGIFPLNDITVVAGIQGIGKSLMAIDLAARVSRGLLWPDGTKCIEGGVILMAAEDDVATTIVPRLNAVRADTTRIAIVQGSPSIEGGLVPFDLKGDMTRLKGLLTNGKAILGIIPKLVIIDPISSYVGNIDTHRDNQVRNVLFRLRANIATEFNVAVVCIMHLKKGTEEASSLEKIMGSVAFTAMARCVWAFCQCPDDDDRRFFVPVKHNLAKRSMKGWECFILSGRNKQGILRWGEQTNQIADDLMVDRGMKPEAKKSQAMEIISDKLKNGPVHSIEVIEAVIMADISRRTCENAKEELHVVSVRRDGKWVWYLPGMMGRKDESKSVKVDKAKIETKKLVDAIAKNVKTVKVKPSPIVKTEKQLTMDEVSRCVREFEKSGLFAPLPEED